MTSTVRAVTFNRSTLDIPAPAPRADRLRPVRERALEVPRIPNERTRMVVQYQDQEEITFGGGIKQLREMVKTKDYTEAHNIADQLMDLYLAFKLDAKETKSLFVNFRKIVALGQAKLGNSFYAFLKSVIASRLREEAGHDPEEVIATYKIAEALGNSDAMFYLGTYYNQLERFDEGIQQFLKCTQTFPNRSDAFREVAVFHQQSEPADLQAAEDYYRKAIALGCKDSACDLAVMLEAQPVDTDELRQEIIDLYTIAKERNHADAAYNLGVIHQTGWNRTNADGEKLCDEGQINYKEAEANFRLAYTLETTDVNAVAVAEIIFDNKLALTEARWKEMQDLIQLTKSNGSFDSLELEKKIEEAGAPHFPARENMMSALAGICNEAELENSGLMLLAQKSILVAGQKPAPQVATEIVADKAPVIETEVERLTRKLMNKPESVKLLHKLALAQLQATKK